MDLYSASIAPAVISHSPAADVAGRTNPAPDTAWLEWTFIKQPYTFKKACGQK